MNDFHIGVLLQEAVDYLNVKPHQKYIDATIGGGGHSFEILKRGGNVLGIDMDQEAIDYVEARIKKESLILVRGNFKDIKQIAKDHGFAKVAGIIFDLGVSNHQLETSERGFSFQKDAPLDMRMDKNLAVTAADLVNSLTKGELYELFTKFGEEIFSRAISSAIVRARQLKKIETTGELANIVSSAVSNRGNKGIHPGTKVFQSLRIVVNDEINNLKQALPQAVSLLESHGRLVVIAFHSLEDRIVKHTFAAWQKEKKGIILTKKPLTPEEKEINENRRSRSAKLRVFEKI